MRTTDFELFITGCCVEVMEWLDLERNAEILQKTDLKIAEKLRAKNAAFGELGTGSGRPLSAAQKV